jgi:hypothetical protein
LDELEYWNKGMLGSGVKMFLFFIIPLFHHSIIPLFSANLTQVKERFSEVSIILDIESGKPKTGRK